MAPIYEPERDDMKARDRAFTQAEAKAAVGDPTKTLKWLETAPEVTYAPYVVKIHSLAGPTDPQAKVSFIDCATGDDLGNPISIDLTDRALVWNQLPSTLTGWAQGTTDCAFLFFSSQIDARATEASKSGGGQGKWPRGADLAASYRELRGLMREIFKQNPTVGNKLSQLQQLRLRELLEAGPLNGQLGGGLGGGGP